MVQSFFIRDAYGVNMRNAICIFAAIALSACAGHGPSQTALIPPTQRQTASLRLTGHLGHTLFTKTGGQVFGFDINQNGNDGILATSKTTNTPGVYHVDIETFDQNTGTILSSFASQTGSVNSYALDGIFFGDTALVTHFTSSAKCCSTKRTYELVSPATATKFTGSWTPPITNQFDVQQVGVNQSTSQGVAFAYEFTSPTETPVLIVSNVAGNTFSNVIRLDRILFQGANGPQMAQYTAAGEAVIALSPDAGAVGNPGAAPINAIIDLATGTKTQFTGFNNGTFGSGFVNGLAVDPNTGIAATTTELNAQVEFYDIAHHKKLIADQLPCTGSTSQFNSGAGVGVDPLHKLFLVTDPNYACASSGSALVVYNEAGTLVETITGFKFVIAEPPPVVNPSKRMGWLFGPGFNNLQQFFY